MCLRLEKKIKLWFYWCFPTNRAHALDLYLVFMSRTHFKQSVGELIPHILQVKVLNPLDTYSGYHQIAMNPSD